MQRFSVQNQKGAIDVQKSMAIAPFRFQRNIFCWSLFSRQGIISVMISWRLPCPTRGRRPMNYIDCIARDIGHETADMQTIMSDRDNKSGRGIVYSTLLEKKCNLEPFLSRISNPGGKRFPKGFFTCSRT